ncbi:MAG: IS110 family transposase [Taibaiella sp.]
MTNIANYVGVDVSKKTLDLAIRQANGSYLHKKVSNDIVGFKKILPLLPASCCIVMEATSSYYMPFAYFLHSNNILVSIVNPLTVNHFCKMRMSRTKTDKKDASMIAEYGKSEMPRLWIPKEPHLIELQQMEAIVDNLTRNKTVVSNQKEAFVCSGQMTTGVEEILERQLSYLESEIKIIENKMLEIGERHHAELLRHLRSIPSIGKRTALMLLIITDGFTKFENAKGLVSYVGLCPRLYESGSSIKGKGRICKMGMSRMRQLLYLCAMSAIKVNNQCKTMFERLKQRGKNGKLAIVAVASKLLRQAFAVGTGNIPYNTKIQPI